MATSLVLPLILAPLIGWRLYKRFHRLTRKQPLSAWRMRVTMWLLPVFLALLALGSMRDTTTLVSLAAGAVLGVGLAGYGLTLTKFERNGDQLFYTHNMIIGIGLFALLVGRFAYRIYQIYEAGGDLSGMFGPGASQATMHSPVTMFILGIILAYYARYAAGILRWRRLQLAAPLAGVLPSGDDPAA